MQKNGQVKIGKSPCPCGNKSVTEKDGVPLCKECAENFDRGREANLEPE